MSGGLRTSVKGYLIAQRAALVEEAIDSNVATSQDPAPFTVADTSMDSSLYGFGICDGSIPCIPLLSSAAKSMASHVTRTRDESPPHQGVDLKSTVPSVSVPSSPQTDGVILQSFNLKSIHFNELRKATTNFHSDNVLHEGIFGCVFKGRIHKHSFRAAEFGIGMAVAIKKLDSDATLNSFMTEVNSHGQLGHPNLLKPLAYCIEDDMQLLVYEFMAKGSLDMCLYGSASDIQTLSWDLRMKIALGAAKGLAFLHTDEAKGLYGNFRTSKILLDSDYNVKLCGYGLAMEGLEGYRFRSHVLYHQLPWYEDRAPGYMAPILSHYVAPECRQREEYLTALHLTPRSDVYSFGVVLLELLSGRRVYDEFNKSDLVQLASVIVSSRGKLHKIMDSRIVRQYSMREAVKALELATSCLSKDSHIRPDMSHVVQTLEKLQFSGHSREALLLGISENEDSGQNVHASSSKAPKHRRRGRTSRNHNVSAASASHQEPSVSRAVFFSHPEALLLKISENDESQDNEDINAILSRAPKLIRKNGLNLKHIASSASVSSSTTT